MAKIDEKDLKKLFEELQVEDKRDIAFEKIHIKYNKLIYGIAFSILKNKEDAEDITQVFFSKLYTMEKEKMPKENIASWMYTVAKNEAICLLRNKKTNFDIETIYEIEDKNDEINKITDAIEFNKLISKLNNKEKEILSLKILSDLSFDKISKLLNEPTGTVKWRYYKGINSLKLIITNLGLSIITFIIGLKTASNNKMQMSEKNEEELIKENETQNKTSDSTTNSETQETTEETKKEIERQNIIINDIENINTTNTMIDAKNEESSVTASNYNTVFFAASSIFLAFAIIFTIFFTKHQLKLKKKTSKY